MIQPSIERIATAPEVLCCSFVVVVSLLEAPLRAWGVGVEELSMSISLDSIFARIGVCERAGGGDRKDFDAQWLERKMGGC